jgi:diguanylate cyclase (GGDEF)-like protein
MIRRSRSFLIDYFIHPRLRQHADTLHRVRLVVAALIIFSVLLSGVVASTLLTYAADGSVWISVLINILLIAINIVMLNVIRYTGNYRICAVIEIIAIMTGVVIGIWLSGGIVASPVAQLLILAPLLGYVFGGTRWGSWMLVLTLLEIAVFGVLHFYEYPFAQSVGPESMGTARMTITLLNLSVVAAMGWVYESTTKNLQYERDAEHQRYMRLAKIDPLTGLENRRNFDAEVERRMEMAVAQGSQPRFTLCFIDLDGFKTVNDRHGHNVGDEVLRVVSDRLRSASRAIDVVGRHGGDEFLLMLDAVSDRATLDTMARRIIDSLKQPISTSVGIVEIGASIGFAQFPEDAADLDGLKKAADLAMYEAKRERSGWVFFRQGPGVAPL